MKLMPCPRNGLRPLHEFTYGGLFRPAVDPHDMSDGQWGDYLFNQNGVPGTVKEWWYHAPSGTWFIAERDNVADQVTRTYSNHDEENNE